MAVTSGDPYVGFAIGGKVKHRGTIGEDLIELDEKIVFGNGEEAEMERSDFGLGVGVGLQFDNIQAWQGCNLGLVNIIPENGFYKTKNNGLTLTVTYLFGK